MKIAYILGGLPFGGIERWLFDLCLEFRANGLVELRVINLSGTGELMRDYLEAGIPMECIANSKRTLVTYRIDTTARLRTRLKALAPDVIHTMHFSANHHGRLAAYGLGIPVLTHIHNIKREKRFVRRTSDKLLSHATTAYLAVSNAVAGVVHSDHNRAGRPVHVLYNALDLNRFSGEALDLERAYGLTRPVIIGVGRYVPQKNFDLLIRATRILHDQGTMISLMLVGEGPERPPLEALRDELGLEKYVVLTGFQDDVAAHYKASDVFCLPSQFEGFPISHLEAMSCGLPAVISPFVPSREVAEPASLVCACNAEDIAADIARILGDQALRTRLVDNARDIAAQHSMPHYAMELYNLYRDLTRPDSGSADVR